MDAFSQTPLNSEGQVADPRPQPTPDYGSLGPGSDVSANAGEAKSARPGGSQVRLGPIIASIIGEARLQSA